MEFTSRMMGKLDREPMVERAQAQRADLVGVHRELARGAIP
jgi:hypothetical protein